MSGFQTGDILLFQQKAPCWKRPWSCCIQCCTNSKYTHVGLVLKDVDAEHPGAFIWDAAQGRSLPDYDTKTYDFGVQVRPLEAVIQTYQGHVFWRSLRCRRDGLFSDRIRSLYTRTKDIPYDMEVDDLVRGWANIQTGNLQEADAMHCSSFCGYVYSKLGLLPETTPWVLLRPKEWGSEDGRRTEYMKFQNGVILDPEVLIK